MPLELTKDTYSGPINEVVIGKNKTIRLGGQATMPFLFDEGPMPNAPVVALEIFDCAPRECAEAILAPYGDAVKDPVAWATAAVTDFGAQALAVRLQGIHPDWFDHPPEKAAATLAAIARKVDVPLIVIGSGDEAKDSDVLPKVSQALKGANCLFGVADQKNYKTLTATCLADGHALIAESPIDINIAKQMNILITDMGFDPKRIVMHPTTTALGYGMEYVYSIIERSRLAAYIGDKMLAMPFIVFVGQEVWKTKEAKDTSETQGINWEIATATSLVQAGADLIVMSHPYAARSVVHHISTMMQR